ncbi:tyrosine-type recombinase/integrase [Allorhizocola rhizosphaerae]|uniref:tyrosine-type recombinase/integrase n=1 Tax=Allorhizocola rhizosphaerae TaxID=1872709 RepID=UPI000E3EDCF6|nr:site-specific integrase [Allorhizocola rhizosphaerae]
MARRNANGEGSIYRRSDGRYEAAAYFLTTSGVRKRIRVYAKTRQEAHAKLTESKQKASQGIPVPGHSWRLGGYLDYWLEKVIRPGQRPSTYTRYESIVRLHLKPVLGHLLLSQLSVPMVQACFNDQRRGGASLRTVQITREVLRSALSNAMREELLVRNVAALTQLEKRTRRKVQPWTATESRAFLDAITGDPYYAALLIVIIYGLRRGEVLGLRRRDVDFAVGKLYIRNQLQRVHGKLMLVPPKSEAGVRDLALVGLVADVLRDQRTPDADETAFVFTGKDGNPLEPGSLLRAFRRLCIKHGFRPIRLHDLRHSQATLLKKLGVQPRDAQLILGHASVQTTQEIYQHGDEEEQRKTLQQVERIYLRSAMPERVAVKIAIKQPASGFRNRGQTWLGMRDSKSLQPFLEDSPTGVMLAVQGRSMQWLLGRVAVKNSRQITTYEPQRNPMELWQLTRHWLEGPTHGW